MKNYISDINDILFRNNGIISRKEVMEKGIASVYFSKFIKENNLIKINKSEYIDKNYLFDIYSSLQKRFSSIIYSGYSALYLNKLIDWIPDYIEFSVYKNYRINKKKLSFDVIMHIENNEEALKIGNAYLNTDFGNSVLSFSKEKIIVEMIRRKEDYDLEIYNKALKNYAKRKDKDIEFLLEYAKFRKIDNKVQEIMEIIMYEN